MAGRCWKWPDVPSSCDDRGWESPGVARNLRSLALGLALGVATDCESPAAQPLQRLGRDAARIVLLVFAAELLHVLVVALGEHCPPGLAHARDHGDCRPGKPNAWQARRSCRSPVGRTAGAVHAQVRSGGSRTSHPSCRAWPFPFAFTGEPRRRCRGDGIQHRRELRVDGARTVVEELQRGHRPIRRPHYQPRLIGHAKQRQLVTGSPESGAGCGLG